MEQASEVELLKRKMHKEIFEKLLNKRRLQFVEAILKFENTGVLETPDVISSM